MTDPKNLFDTKPAIVSSGRFPEWLHRKMPSGTSLWDTHRVVETNRLHTVCEEAKCPNILECYSKKTAAFLILGKSCTRACGFCEIAFSQKPNAPDPHEPDNVARSIQELGLKHAVITMVARDDLEDGGAEHLAKCLRAVRASSPEVTVEVLTSDFQGNKSALDVIIREAPEIFNHNIETVERLTPQVRHRATYRQTLDVLSYVKKKNPESLVKSGLMLGLSEKKEEVTETLKDLKEAGCDIVTIGQYLQASKKKLAVKSFIHPDVFREFEAIGKALGISHMYAGPFVRSSYNANLFVKRKNNEIVSIESQ